MHRKFETYRILRPTEKEIAFMHSWETQRTFPKWKYILLNGILKEGLVLFTLIKIVQFLIERDAFAVFYSSFYGIIFLFFEIIFWFLGGYVIGWFKFNSREIEYELLKGLSD